MKHFVYAAILGCFFSGAVQATAIDLDNSRVASVHVVAPSPVARNAVVRPPLVSVSELPEPEVFAMMLVGLILIGYRASRDSNEKFK